MNAATVMEIVRISGVTLKSDYSDANAEKETRKETRTSTKLRHCLYAALRVKWKSIITTSVNKKTQNYIYTIIFLL